jgi:hypothetical protein
MEVKIESEAAIWQTHKDLLRKADISLSIDWDRRLPDNKEALDVLIRRSEQWVNPKTPVDLTESELKETVERLLPQIEEIWGRKMAEMPAIELAAPEAFLKQVKQYEDLTNSMFGYGESSESPPTAFLTPLQKTLLLPCRFILKAPGQLHGIGASASATSHTSEALSGPWDKSYLEEALATVLSQAIFRQARHEWGSDYLTSMMEVGPDSETKICAMANVSAQIANEKLCAQYPQWALHVVSDAILGVWEDEKALVDYAGLSALSKGMTLMRACMADNLRFTPNGEIRVEFFARHPFNSEKIEAFGTE